MEDERDSLRATLQIRTAERDAAEEAVRDRDARIAQIKRDAVAMAAAPSEERDALRRQVEALAFGASSWHKAHAAGQAMGGLSDRDRKVAAHLLAALESDEERHEVIEALRALLGVERA